MADDETERLALVRKVTNAPQGGAEQQEAFNELFKVLLPDLDRYTRRPYLPPDEAEFIAVEVLAAIRAKNFANLRDYLARRDADASWRLERWLQLIVKSLIVTTRNGSYPRV